jgi:hypothetical protein
LWQQQQQQQLQQHAHLHQNKLHSTLQLNQLTSTLFAYKQGNEDDALAPGSPASNLAAPWKVRQQQQHQQQQLAQVSAVAASVLRLSLQPAAAGAPTGAVPAVYCCASGSELQAIYKLKPVTTTRLPACLPACLRVDDAAE